MRGRLSSLVPSRATALAAAALFVALGGTGYAAVQASDTKSDTELIKKLAPTLSVAGARNAAMLGGVTAAQYQRWGATLPPGHTETGVWDVDGYGGGSAGEVGGVISFPVPLAKSPRIHLVPVGSGPTAQCPGGPANPKAARDTLCVYEVSTYGVSNLFFANPADTNGSNSSSPSRFGVAIRAFTDGNVLSFGSWAVTG